MSWRRSRLSALLCGLCEPPHFVTCNELAMPVDSHDLAVSSQQSVVRLPKVSKVSLFEPLVECFDDHVL